MKFAICLLLSLMIGSAYGQTSSLNCKVIDQSTGDPLIGANVKLGEGFYTTDLDGQFEISEPASSFTIEITYVGFENYLESIQLTQGQTYLEIALKPSSQILNTATITGSKYERNTLNAVSSISVLKPALIKETNAPSIDQVLDKIPGVQIIDGQANIRGGSGYSYGAGSRVLLLVDDIPALQADAGRPNWTDIPVENISQVEILKGASSVLYGSSALNGIIHVRTAYATSTPVTSVSTSYTHFMSPDDARKQWWDKSPFSYNVGLLHKRKIGKLDVVAAGFYHTEDGFYRGTFTNRQRANLNLRYRFNDRLTASVQTVLNNSEAANEFVWANPTTGAYIPFGDQTTTTNALRYYIDPSVNYTDKFNHQHKLKGRYYSIDNQNTNNQSNSSTYRFLEYQFLKNIPSLDMDIIAGATVSAIFSDSELFSDTIFTGNNQAAYIQLQKVFFDKLTVNAGTRAEFNQLQSPAILYGITLPNGGLNKESKLISRAGVNYAYNDHSASRLSWGQGYRYPTITEKYISTSVAGFNIFPNLDLESETGWSAEIGHKQGFSIAKVLAYADLSFFWSQYNNMAEFGFHEEDGVLGFRSQNIGDTDIKGLELELGSSSNIGPVQLNVLGGYTYIDPKYRNFDEDIMESSSSTENILKYRSKHLYNFDIQASYKFISIGIAQRYASQVEAIDKLFFTPVDFVFVKAYLDNNTTDYTITDVRFSLKYKEYKIGFLVNNLFNIEYTKRPALFEAPRNVGIRLSAQF